MNATTLFGRKAHLNGSTKAFKVLPQKVGIVDPIKSHSSMVRNLLGFNHNNSFLINEV